MERSVLWEESLATGNLAFLDLSLGSCHSQSGSYLDSLVGSSLECLVGCSMEWLVGWFIGFLDLSLGLCHSQSGWLVLAWNVWLVLAWLVLGYSMEWLVG